MLFSQLTNRIAAFGSNPLDDEDTRLHKSLLVIFSIPFMLVGTLWGCLFIYWGEERAGLIPLSYGLVSFLSLVYFSINHNFVFFRFSQLLLILLLPFTLMTALGGFINGSAVILWSLVSPLGAMVFDSPQNAPRWFCAYICLVIFSGLLAIFTGIQNQLTDVQVQFFFVINFLGVGSLIFFMVFYFVQKKNFFQKRTEELLLNILPKEIADELKETGTTTARHFEEVTVLFTDFKNFTSVAEKLSPQELVNEINFCYSAFDNIISKYGVEKIKTIGDSYMCAGGLPVPNKTNMSDTVRAALEIRDFMVNEKKNREAEGKEFFEIRIGCNTGPVVAGIVGIKKFAYDIWGDTVNIASRMESSGEPGKVNISGSTQALVKSLFRCEYRGKIEAKNKGMVDMYFVEY